MSQLPLWSLFVSIFSFIFVVIMFIQNIVSGLISGASFDSKGSKDFFDFDNPNFPKKIVAVVLLLWVLNFTLIAFTDEFKANEFGDMFGAVNALFSGLAFAGIIYTIVMQQKEIQHQAKESKKRDFESSFFILLTSYETTRKNFSESLDSVFDLIRERVYSPTFIKDEYHSMHLKWVDLDSHWNTEKLSNSHFAFGNLSSVITYIESSGISNKDFYLEILRSRLYEKDIVILFHFLNFERRDYQPSMLRNRLLTRQLVVPFLTEKYVDAILKESMIKDFYPRLFPIF